MDQTTLTELLTNHLRDVYDAEKQLTKALPRMAKAATDEELAQGFRDHAAETQEQARRLEQVFEALGMKARSKPCAGMKGLIQEGQEIMQEEEGEALDLSLFAAARKVEHYEMVAYDTLIQAARKAKQTEVLNRLSETLQEETQMDKRLANIGKRLLSQSKSSGRAEQESEGASGGRKARAGSTDNGSSRKESGSRNGGGHLSVTSTDPEEIRRWAEDRGGKPACVKGTGGKGDIGMLRIEFPGKPGANDAKLQPISWDDFFEKFEERGLALVYQNKTAGGQKSNFNKLVARETASKPKARAAR